MTFTSTQGPAREPLNREAIDKLRSSVVLDERRTRPLYFDGRFLAARDLVREQQYFLTRQADLGKAGGTGVVYGLMAERHAVPTRLTIGPGHGVTATGELVVVPGELVVDLADLPQIQRLDLTFGLIEIPREPARNRTGLFILALRPVEFSANPIATYPTTLDGQRSLHDGDIVEGVVVTLIPYPDEGAGSYDERRAKVAYDIFVRAASKGLAAPVLPLAMVAIAGGVVQWVDPYLVRREVGADHGDILGLGFAPRALREAHLLQYDHHLREVMQLRGNLGQNFAAADYFRALPPAGRFPRASVSPTEWTQTFFPPTVEVDLSIVPMDELPALLEESLLLPPIDLTRSAEELDSTAVLVLIPVHRSELGRLKHELGTITRPLPPAAPWSMARATPLQTLQSLSLPPTLLAAAVQGKDRQATWAEQLTGTDMLWFIRRRNLQVRADVLGQPAQSLSDALKRLDPNAQPAQPAPQPPVSPQPLPPMEPEPAPLPPVRPGPLPPVDPAPEPDPAPDPADSPEPEPTDAARLCVEHVRAARDALAARDVEEAEAILQRIVHTDTRELFRCREAVRPALEAIAGKQFADALGLLDDLLADAGAAPLSDSCVKMMGAALQALNAGALDDASAMLTAIVSGGERDTEPCRRPASLALHALEQKDLEQAVLILKSALRGVPLDTGDAADPRLPADETAGGTTGTVDPRFETTIARTIITTPERTGTTPAPTGTTTRPTRTTTGTTRPAGTLAPATLSAATLAAMDDAEAGRLRATRGFGAGLDRLGKARPELVASRLFAANLAASGVAAELDGLARTARGAALTSLANAVAAPGLSRSRTAPRQLAAAVRKHAGGEK
jgi:hypothetical protein